MRDAAAPLTVTFVAGRALGQTVESTPPATAPEQGDRGVAENDLGSSIIAAALVLLIVFMLIFGPRVWRADKRRVEEMKRRQALSDSEKAR